VAGRFPPPPASLGFVEAPISDSGDGLTVLRSMISSQNALVVSCTIVSRLDINHDSFETS